MVRRRLRSKDEGFTMVELLVTMVILAVIMVSLIGVQVSALATMAESKQRHEASQLANQAMEQLRALPYNTVTGGLYTGDLTGDSNVTSSGGSPPTYYFHPAYNTGINEQLVTESSAPASPIVPLYPHVQTTVVRGTTFRVSTYVSLAGSDATLGYWLTTIVSWSSHATQGNTKTLAARSRLYSPTGCLSESTHPFSGPCQNFLDGSAGTAPAGITVDTPTANAPILQTSGFNASAASLTLTDVTANLQSEETLSASSRAATSNGQYTPINPLNSVQYWGGIPASALASTDPGTGYGSQATAKTVSQSLSPPSAPDGGGWTLSVAPASGDTATTASTVGNGTSTPPCTDTSNNAVPSSQPCSSAIFAPSGSEGANLAYGGFTIPLAGVTASTASRGYTAIYTTGNGAICANTSGVGCINASSTETLDTVSAGGLPSGGSLTAGFSQPLVNVSGYNVTADAQSGVLPGGQVMSAARAGTLVYWDGTAYSTVALANVPATGATYPLGTATGTYTTGGGITVTTSGTLTIQPESLTPAGTSPCQTASCSATVNSGALIATISYQVTQAGQQVGSFNVIVNLGAALARTTYRAASSG